MNEEVNTGIEPEENQENKILDIGNVTVENFSVGEAPKITNPNNVYFRVKYPKEWKGAKLMPEDVIEVSKESAEQFTSIGIGKIVK